jgi:hypothetical protein
MQLLHHTTIAALLLLLALVSVAVASMPATPPSVDGKPMTLAEYAAYADEFQVEVVTPEGLHIRPLRASLDAQRRSVCDEASPTPTPGSTGAAGTLTPWLAHFF